MTRTPIVLALVAAVLIQLDSSASGTVTIR
jgi:hypothetical protein